MRHGPDPDRTSRLTHPADRIGPNSIIQTVAALREQLGPEAAHAALDAWGLGTWATRVPDEMVPEGDFNRLAWAVLDHLGEVEGTIVLDRAGVLTAEYLLTNRIPRIAQRLLPWLPSGLALRILGRAIGAHAWTFAGSGRFSIAYGPKPVLQIAGCPMCRGHRAASAVCSFYKATFERLLRQLVHPRTRVKESDCEALGAPACRFELRWS
jgi:divinyl protochlorophyllide a 8-vinyl-reductase